MNRGVQRFHRRMGEKRKLECGFEFFASPEVTLEEGLRRTVEWQRARTAARAGSTVA